MAKKRYKKKESNTVDLIRSLWRNTTMTLDDHRFDSRKEKADMIDEDMDAGYTSEYKNDVRKHIKSEKALKSEYDDSWATTNETIKQRRVDRKTKMEALGAEARDTFSDQRTMFMGPRHGITLYDIAPTMDDKTDRRLRFFENLKHKGVVKKYKKRTMKEKIRSEVQGPIFGHGVFMYDRKGPDCSKLYIEQVHMDGNGLPKDIEVRCGNEMLHTNPNELRQWEADGYVIVNPEKLR